LRVIYPTPLAETTEGTGIPQKRSRWVIWNENAGGSLTIMELDTAHFAY